MLMAADRNDSSRSAAVSSDAGEDGTPKTQTEFKYTQYGQQYFHCIHSLYLQKYIMLLTIRISSNVSLKHGWKKTFLTKNRFIGFQKF